MLSIVWIVGLWPLPNNRSERATQVKAAPNARNRTRIPGRRRPRSKASHNAINAEATLVFP